MQFVSFWVIPRRLSSNCQLELRRRGITQKETNYMMSLVYGLHRDAGRRPQCHILSQTAGRHPETLPPTGAKIRIS